MAGELTVHQTDASTRLAFKAGEVILALHRWPVESFTVGELIWLVQMSGHVWASANLATELSEAAASLLRKSGIEEGGDGTRSASAGSDRGTPGYPGA